MYMTKGSRAHIDHFQRSMSDALSAIVHPVQLDGFQGEDFLGVGTAKGVGVDNCPDYYGVNWQAYIDGSFHGDYFCNQPYGSFAGDAKDIRVTIQYMNCNGLNRWGIYVEGDLKLCKTIDATSGMASAGPESISGTGTLQDLTVGLHNLQYRTTSGTWNDYANVLYCVDPGYEIHIWTPSYFSVVME